VSKATPMIQFMTPLGSAECTIGKERRVTARAVPHLTSGS
jgi:hypothetical protein